MSNEDNIIDVYTAVGRWGDPPRPIAIAVTVTTAGEEGCTDKQKFEFFLAAKDAKLMAYDLLSEATQEESDE